MNAALLQNQVESALGSRFPSPFAHRSPAAPETITVPMLDAAAGGLPRGDLTEICGFESSGRTTLLLSVLSEVTRQGEFCALVDSLDSLDPHSAATAGVDLRRLLWVRCHQLEHSLRAAELLLEGGGFGVVVIDLVGIPASLMRRAPFSLWFRLRWLVRNTRTALIALDREPTAGAAASLVVRLRSEAISWSALPEHNAAPNNSDRRRCPPHTRLLSGFWSSAETLRSRRTAR